MTHTPIGQMLGFRLSDALFGNGMCPGAPSESGNTRDFPAGLAAAAVLVRCHRAGAGRLSVAFPVMPSRPDRRWVSRDLACDNA
jgi:hypothetical protein